MNRANLQTWESAVVWLRQQPEKQDLVRAAYFDESVLEAAIRFEGSEEWRETLRILPRPGSALDIGAGRGMASYALQNAGWRVTALEPDPSQIVGAGAIELLNQSASGNIVTVQEWGESLPFDDCTFDLIYCRQLLHHSRDLRRLCSEAFRVLRPGGRFLAVREHVVENYGASLAAFLEQHPLHWLYGGENAFTMNDYQAAIREAGFRKLHVIRPYGAVMNVSVSSMALQHERYLLALESFCGTALTSPLRKCAFLRARVMALGSVCLNLLSRAPGRLYSFSAMRAREGT